MSIDAKITEVTYYGDGTARLRLEASDPKRAPAGQGGLLVINAPKNLEAMIGERIWGGSSDIMHGERKVAERLGYTKIRWLESDAAVPPGYRRFIKWAKGVLGK